MSRLLESTDGDFLWLGRGVHAFDAHVPSTLLHLALTLTLPPVDWEANAWGCRSPPDEAGVPLPWLRAQWRCGSISRGGR
eukprot:3222891-Alexandrium_andersonii.AAC.1